MNQLASSPVSDSDGTPTTPSPAPRRMPQIGLSTLLLATACIAAWVSAWMNGREIQQLEQKLASMRSLARELVIKDRDHIAIVQQQPELYDQQIWHVYVPGDSLGLHLVTRDIPSAPTAVVQKYAGPVASAHLPAGRHVVELKSELKQHQWITQVFIDDHPAITVREPEEWNAGRGSSGGGAYADQADSPPDKPAILFSRLFMLPDGPVRSKPPSGPSGGIVLWIGEWPPAVTPH